MLVIITGRIQEPIRVYRKKKIKSYIIIKYEYNMIKPQGNCIMK